ncbi:hypothetical protein [Dactylosporangium matsuzakiense]|nr:hypothetical protein [Dactylosporangium matsuzakiense]UWZ41420.1 hypothetical protein Dmats_27550 [Dactylosporangium matsuzakiense]
MQEDVRRGRPIRDLGDWTIDRLEAFTAAHDGEALEQVRVVAQSHVYRSGEPRPARLRWAKLSLLANERLHGDDPWEQARMAGQAFALRTWVIEHLGPDADPDWDPAVLAADTLAALPADPDDARARCAGRRDLPVEHIGELRRQKNLSAHASRLAAFLRPGAAKDRIAAWAAVHNLLP